MLVISKQGAQCPKEGKPRDYITDSEPVEVPETCYYKRLLDDGSLEIVEAPKIKEGGNKK
ncbi:MAG: hypothetical protein Q8J64_06610 [Thermodesulfovibrionales bacterium]|nr:hypothetical protein [Thermodesulfovibrionales bacterium]